MSLVKEVNRKRILDAKIQEYGRSYARKQCKEEMDTYFGCIKGLLIYIYISSFNNMFIQTYSSNLIHIYVFVCIRSFSVDSLGM